MDERKPDTTVCIPFDEYKELLRESVLYDNLRVEYWELKAKYEKLAKQMSTPTFGGKEEEKDETAS